MKEEARNDSSASKRNRNQVELRIGRLVKLMSSLLDRCNVHGVGDVEVARILGEGTGSQGGDELRGCFDWVQAWIEAVGDSGEGEDSKIAQCSVFDVLVE